MKKEIVKFPHVVDGVSSRVNSGEQIDLIGEGILKIPRAEFIRKGS